MRFSSRCLLFAAFLAVAAPACAEETLSDGLREASAPLRYALSLIGAPYKFGGKDPKAGVDCSGFVRHVYKQTADRDLPHNAAKISQAGDPVEKSDLQPGDLVFFNTLRRSVSHVGIYAGDGKFVHASSTHTKKVMVSSMDEKYWARRFAGARRLLGVN